jgi:hypothetical protein
MKMSISLRLIDRLASIVSANLHALLFVHSKIDRTLVLDRLWLQTDGSRELH